MAGQQTTAVFDGLPKQFVSSLKVLFDILDPGKSGYVFFADIEKYWDDQSVHGLPRDVLSCLKKVTPPSGMLSFENFVLGLKRAMIPKFADDFSRHSHDSVAQLHRSVSGPVTLANYHPDHPGLKKGHGHDGAVRAVHQFRDNVVPNQVSPSKQDLAKAVHPNYMNPLHHRHQHHSQSRLGPYADPNHTETKLVPHGRPLSERDPNRLNIHSDGSNMKRTLPRDRAQSDSVSNIIRKFENQKVERDGLPRHKAVSMEALSGPSQNILSENKENLHHLPGSYDRQNYGQIRGENQSHKRSTNGYHGEQYTQNAQETGDKKSPGARQTLSPPVPSSGHQSYQTVAKASGQSPTNKCSHYFPPLQEDNEVEQINSFAQFSDQNSPSKHGTMFHAKSASPQKLFGSRSPVDRKSNYSAPIHNNYVGHLSPPVKGSYKKTREPRRHTLQNGVDFNMVKRMKQLEQERDILFQGMETVERAREWYQKQIQITHEKQKNIGKFQYLDYSVEAQQERMNFQMARIFEVNQKLQALIESSEKGFPLHIDFPNQRINSEPDDELVDGLKEQNRTLTQDLHERNDRIQRLEKEKSVLVRELFEERAKHRPFTEDATIM